MGMTQGARQALYEYLFNAGSAPSWLTTGGDWYVALHDGAPGVDGAANEVTGTDYARVATSAATWGTASTATPSVVSNVAAITFPTAGTGGWGTVSAFSLWTASSGGTCVWTGTLNSQAIVEGNTPEIAIGEADITITSTV